MARGFATKQGVLQSTSDVAIGGATTYLNFRRRKWNMNNNQNASKRQKINQESSKRGVVTERRVKDAAKDKSPKKVTLLKPSNWLRHTSTKHEQSLAHGYYQEPCPAHFDGVSGIGTKALTEAFIKSMCPNWLRIYVTIQFQGKPRLEFAYRVLKEAAILRDKSLIGRNFNRTNNARYRTIDWFFEEQGAGANSGNRHYHGIVLITPDHPKLQEVERAITNAVIEGMVRHLTKSQSPNANANHHSKLLNRQNAKSGKVVLAERCLNAASCLGYSMKQFDICKEHFASMDYMPKEQLKRIGMINKDAVTNFIEALPDPPLYVRRLSALEREAQSTPHPGGAWM